MTILIGKYSFDGPYSTAADLEENPGLYAVLHYEGKEYELLHVAHADNIKDKIEISRSAYSQITGAVLLAVCYTPACGARERSLMVEDIKHEFADPCNDECNTQPLPTISS